MGRKAKDDFVDDGRTIVPMDVEGMPWSTRGIRDVFREDPTPASDKPPMSREERRGYVWAAVKAGLLVALVFCAAFALFLLFCRYVWFK